MEPISLPSLKDQIADRLRGEILSGRLADGKELTQESVAASLRVSRIPVREAFLRLEAEGLLERLPNRHVRVSAVTPGRLRQNCRVLAAMEAEMAALLVSDGGAGGLEAPLARCREACARRDWPALRAADRAFHLALSAGLDNGTLRRLHESQRRVLLEAAPDALRPDWDRVMALDEAICRAALAGDQPSLRRAVYDYYTLLAETAGKEPQT